MQQAAWLDFADTSKEEEPSLLPLSTLAIVHLSLQSSVPALQGLLGITVWVHLLRLEHLAGDLLPLPSVPQFITIVSGRRGEGVHHSRNSACCSPAISRSQGSRV